MDGSSPQFDSEMLIIADRDISPETPLVTSVISSQTGNSTVMGPMLLEFLALIEEIRTLRLSPEITKGMRKLETQKVNQLNVLFNIFVQQKLISKHLLEVLTEGSTKVALWIDSEGGEVEQEDKVNYAMDFLDKQKSAVHSYVGVKAASAAFDMAFLADEINVLNKSVFMWHLSESDDLPRVERVKQLRLPPQKRDPIIQDEIEDLVSILERAHPEHRKTFIAQVDAQLSSRKNVDGAIYMNGRHLHNVGLVHKSFSHMGALVDQFEADFPLHADRNLAFLTTGIAKKVFKAISRLPSWLDEEPLRLSQVFQDFYEKGTPLPRPIQAVKSAG